MIMKSIRELGGELWSEMESRRSQENSTPIAFQKLSTKEISEITDFLMQILARYVGCIIENDDDLPVKPLPKI